MYYSTENRAAQARIMRDNPEPPVKEIFCTQCGGRAAKAYWIDGLTLCDDCFRDYALAALESEPTETLADLLGAEIWEE